MSQRWIDREAAGKILKGIQNHKQGVQIYLIKADAGTGKTYLARDIGVNLGSKSGYEPGHTDKNVHWSGILDLYDPETNNNRGLEQLLIQAFSDHPSIEFQDYQKERKNYANMSKGGSSGVNLEEQRHNVERAFSFEMRMIAREKHLVWAFDTVERLQSALDPTEIRLGGELETSMDDTASVVGWMLYQITRLPRATILLFGRTAERLESRLSTAFKEADALREKSDGPIHFKVIDLSLFSKDETEQFFALRSEKHPSLKKILTNELKSLMFDGTKGNPLLLDIALETIHETGKINEIGNILAKDIKEVEKLLIKTYMNQGLPETKILLRHLALARNGLSPQLLECLEPLNSARYLPELEKIGDLPFVKVRQVSTKTSGSAKPNPQPTYFLHDAMYVICDEVLLKPVQAREDAERIVRWYKTTIAEKENKLKEKTQLPAESKGRRDDDIQDLLVESLFYRMRANPKEGYEWYLQQADYALNAVETGLEMRLRDSMAQFAVNAKDDTVDSASSQIDRENIKNLFPDMLQQFTIDSAMLWVRRLSFRGLHEQAIHIASSTDWVKGIYKEKPKLYSLAYADFQLWTGQALMYSGNAQNAVDLYKSNTEVLEDYSLSDIKQNKEKYSEFVLQRITHIKGRTLNNLGYIYWMYFGKYKPALTKLAQALEYFQAANLTEEEANTKDNMGRIRALLWHEPAARLLIEDGLRMREEKKMVYRTALSHISLANMQHRFRYFQLAVESAKKAMEIFKSLEGQRGIGLAHLTFAMIYRSMAESWQEQSINNESAVKYVQDAIDELNLAARIFKEIVQEKIRYVYALNEMGSCYRAMYMLSIHDGKASDERKQEVFEEGVSYYKDAIKAARENNYFVEELDSKQDLAVLYARAKKHEEALEQLEQIRNFIPHEYQIQLGKGLDGFSEDDVTDAYYKLMGQVEMLAGAIVFDKIQTAPSPSKDMVAEAMEHYVLAVAYYSRYSNVSSNTYVMTTERIYKRLHDIKRDIIFEIKRNDLPNWINKYNIPAEWVTPLFSDIFEMLGV